MDKDKKDLIEEMKFSELSTKDPKEAENIVARFKGQLRRFLKHPLTHNRRKGDKLISLKDCLDKIEPSHLGVTVTCGKMHQISEDELIEDIDTVEELIKLLGERDAQIIKWMQRNNVLEAGIYRVMNMLLDDLDIHTAPVISEAADMLLSLLPHEYQRRHVMANLQVLEAEKNGLEVIDDTDFEN